MGARIKVKKFNGIPVLEIHGRVESQDAVKISKRLEALVKKDIEKTVIDLSNIDFLDSHWMGVFVYVWKLYNESGKDLVFLISSSYILELFETSNLDKTFTIVRSLDEIGEADTD
jgi:anti-anti-sigma factor